MKVALISKVYQKIEELLFFQPNNYHGKNNKLRSHLMFHEANEIL